MLSSLKGWPVTLIFIIFTLSFGELKLCACTVMKGY